MTEFPRQLRMPTAASAALALGLLSLALRHDGGAPPIVAGALLALLAVIAEHQRVALRSGIDVSPGLVVLMASLVVFRASDALAGPLLVAACSGVHLASTRPGRRGWIAFHAASSALAAAAACAVYWIVPVSAAAHVTIAILMLVPAGAAAVAVESAVVALSYRGDKAARPRAWLPELPTIALEVTAFAAAGAAIGLLAVSLGSAMLLLLLVPVLLAPRVLATPAQAEIAQAEAVQTLMRALEVKDPYTAAHAERVARYATYIGVELEMKGRRLEQLRLAALLHDIGKLVVPNHLLNKPGRLTSDEFDIVRRHEYVSVAMLSRIDGLIGVARIVADSRHDTAAELRSLDAHVIAVADAYDAMASTRSYRQALPQDLVFAELRAKSGTQFLGPCVEALIVALERHGETSTARDHGAGYRWMVAPPRCGVGSAGLGDLAPGDLDDLDRLVDVVYVDDVHGLLDRGARDDQMARR